MKRLMQIVIFLFIHSIFAQVDYSSSWEDFFLYNNVKDFIKKDNKIYAIIDNALFTYNITTEEMVKISSINGLSGENTASIYYSKFFDKVIIGYETGLLEIIDNKNSITIAKDIVNFNYSGSKLINNITEYEGKLYISTPFAIVVSDLEISQFGDTYFIGNQSSDIAIHQIKIHPVGPVSNLPFSISVKDNNLWVIYITYDSAYTPLGRRFGFSHFNGENCLNTAYSDVSVRDLVHITYDPNNINKAYLSSCIGRILIVEDDLITAYWNHTNSGLEKLVYTPNPNYTSIRINGSSFDTQGNLWIANAWVDDRIIKYSADGSWSSFDMSSVITNPALGLNEPVIDKTTNIWIGSRRNGVLVFNENGNSKKSLTTELTKGALPDLNARTVKVDSNNRIWIGTKKGLVVYYNAANVFNENNIDAEPIIILDDGVPKKLLGEQPVNSIPIDGTDNKWFGTETGGVLQTNPGGLTTINNFNKDNSPRTSNNILKIDIDNNTGKVFFATDKGIVAFNSNVSSYGDSLPEVYTYPNPSTKSNELFGGKAVSNKVNLTGNKVASGIYIVLPITEDNTETTAAKIAIIN